MSRKCVYARVLAQTKVINICFFELICKSMSLFKCILCFKEIEKGYERFLVQTKKNAFFDVNVALANLEFHMYVVSSRGELICSRTWKTYKNP